MTKPLAEMTMDELRAERTAAHDARFKADYIEGLYAWRVATEAADQRLREVNAAIAAREAHKGTKANG